MSDSETSALKKNWLTNAPALYAAIGAAVGAVIQLVIPDRTIPLPLEGYRNALPMIVAVAFIVVLLSYNVIQRRKRLIGIALGVSILSISLIQAVLVRKADDEHYLVGFVLTATGRADCNGCMPEQILENFVPTFGTFARIWGWSFVVPAVLYVLLYSAVVFGVVAAPAALRRASRGKQ